MAATLLETTYDGVFRDLAALTRRDYPSFALPPEFIKAVAFHESNYNPKAAPPPEWNSSAYGMFQILNGTRERFNKATGKSYSRDDMADPMKCGEVGVWHFCAEIMPTYAKSGVTAIANPQWDSAQYVALLDLGYTAGWSLTQGVPFIGLKVADKIGQNRVNVETVIDAAQILFPKSTIYVDPKQLVEENGKKRGPYMSHPSLRSHVMKVADSYFKIRKAWGTHPPEPKKPEVMTSEKVGRQFVRRHTVGAVKWVAGTIIGGYLFAKLLGGKV